MEKIKMKNLKNFVFTTLLFLFAQSVYSFDWPQSEITANSFKSYFGQNRDSLLSTSLIFTEPTEIKAAEKGFILAILTEDKDEMDFFPSTLGTAVIISHEDNMLSVYGNIDQETLTLNYRNSKTVDAGEIIGQVGISGYQVEKGNLEFQIIDTNNKSAINPKILMPRTESELPLRFAGIMIESKDKDIYDANIYKTYKSGLYRVYFKRNEIAVPYKTAVSINGILVDQISYDTITQRDNKLCVNGKKKYTSADVFPDGQLQLLGEAMFTPGRVDLGLSITDFFGNVQQLNYNIIIK